MCAMYSKRVGTSGISGQLYESKLISLLYFRALHDDRIKEFKLASNINNIGDFDDICFTAEVDGFDKPVAFFVQAKHRENKNQILKIDLDIYFNSYLKIRQCFDQSKEMFFKGSYDDVECLFVFYTTAKDQFSNDSKLESNFCSILNDLIGTDGTTKHPDKRDEDVKLLCKVAMNQRMTCLAERLAKFINNDSKYQMMLTEDLVRSYHVILAEKVLNVSELQPDGYRIATFRHDFFDTHEEYLVLFKNALIKEILKNRKTELVDIEHFLSDFLNEPNDASKLSKLIGTVITYNDDQLEFNKQSIKDLKLDMKLTDISSSTVSKAVELAAKEILLSPKFKQRVPSTFGNKDLTLSGSETKKTKRINHLASKIIDLFVNCKSSKIITIDESLDDGFLQLNGGIAGGIGNIFVLDDSNSKLMKITNNKDSLGIFAKKLYERLNEKIELINTDNSENKIPNLCEYKFLFNSNKFPKLLLDCSENEGTVRDFLNKLVIFSSQANVEGVETILKNEIDENQLNEPNYFQAKTDAIFATFHDEIQKWWIHPDRAPYLTRESDLFQKAKHVIKDQLVSVVNFIYQIKINRIDCTFTENEKFLNLQDQQLKTVITTENTILTVVKVIQHLRNKSHIILDLEYVVNLPRNDCNKLREELKNTQKDTVLILVCDEIQSKKKKILETILEAVLSKNTIIVTKRACVEILQKYYPEPSKHDEENSLNNMSEKSHKSIMESAKVIFQGIEVGLDLILDDKSKEFVKGDILHKIINKETIVVGTLNVSRNYDAIKYLYIERRIQKTKIKSNPIMRYLYHASSIVPEIPKPEGSNETLEEEPSCSSKNIETPDHTLEVTVINKLSYKHYKNEQSLSTDVMTTLELLLGDSIEEQKDEVPDETLKKKSSLSSEAVENCNNTLYEDQEVVYVIPKKKANVSGIFVNTLTNTSELPDHVVIVLAEPGMGKSTLLTNLSIKTKELKPEVWIIRINLLQYSEELSKWKDNDTTIDLLETLNFMCQVILRDKLGKKEKVRIVLEEESNVVYLKYCTADPPIQFELNLFLHFYFEREIIFLFDGFDEICPHYTDVVIKCLKCIVKNLRNHRIWIASRPYNEVKSILEEEFGPSYEIDNFSDMEMIQYLHRFWEINLRLEELNNTQLENVKGFFEYLCAMNTEQKLAIGPLHFVNLIAVCHLINESKNKHIPLPKSTKLVATTSKYSFMKLNPLFLYLAALYISDNIKEEHEKNTRDWFLDFETFTVYKHFLKTKIKRRYIEKNEYKMEIPDTITAYEKDISKSIIDYKRLGAFVIFNPLAEILLSTNDLEKIEENIKEFEKAIEKTGLVESVSNGIPIFTHMSFAEHFAVEYVCDRLKHTNKLSYLDKITEVGHLINIMFSRRVNRDIRIIFDHKLRTDKTLMSILEDRHEVIFKWLWDRSLFHKNEKFRLLFCFPMYIAVEENLKNCELLFRKTITHALLYTNITDLMHVCVLFYMFDLRFYNRKVFERILSKYQPPDELEDDFLQMFYCF